MVARFDDRACGPDGEELYEGTERITAFDRRLTELGIVPVGAPGVPA